MNVSLPLPLSPRVFWYKVFTGKRFYPCRAALEEVEGDVTELELKLDKVSFLIQRSLLWKKSNKVCVRVGVTQVHSWEVAVGEGMHLGPPRDPSLCMQHEPAWPWPHLDSVCCRNPKSMLCLWQSAGAVTA